MNIFRIWTEHRTPSCSRHMINISFATLVVLLPGFLIHNKNHLQHLHQIESLMKSKFHTSGSKVCSSYIPDYFSRYNYILYKRLQVFEDFQIFICQNCFMCCRAWTACFCLAPSESVKCSVTLIKLLVTNVFTNIIQLRAQCTSDFGQCMTVMLGCMVDK